MSGIGKPLITIAEFDGNELVVLTHFNDAEPPHELARITPSRFSAKNLAQDLATDLESLIEDYQRSVEEGYL